MTVMALVIQLQLENRSYKYTKACTIIILKKFWETFKLLGEHFDSRKNIEEYLYQTLLEKHLIRKIHR